MFQKFDIKTKNAFVALRLILSDSTLYTLFAHAVLKLLKWHFNALQKSISSYCFVFVCVEVLRPSQPSGVMSSAVSLPNHTFTGQA